MKNIANILLLTTFMIGPIASANENTLVLKGFLEGQPSAMNQDYVVGRTYRSHVAPGERSFQAFRQNLNTMETTLLEGFDGNSWVVDVNGAGYSIGIGCNDGDEYCQPIVWSMDNTVQGFGDSILEYTDTQKTHDGQILINFFLTAISDNGQVVGTTTYDEFFDVGTGNYHPPVLQSWKYDIHNGEIVLLDSPDPQRRTMVANHVNDMGYSVGYAYDYGDNGQKVEQLPVMWDSQGAVTVLSMPSGDSGITTPPAGPHEGIHISDDSHHVYGTIDTLEYNPDVTAYLRLAEWSLDNNEYRIVDENFSGKYLEVKKDSGYKLLADYTVGKRGWSVAMKPNGDFVYVGELALEEYNLVPVESVSQTMSADGQLVAFSVLAGNEFKYPLFRINY